MLVRPSALLLAALALAVPARAEPARAPVLGAAGRAPGADLALPKLRSLLFDRLPGTPLRVPGSPRYLALKDATARGTRAFVGWVLPGLTASDLPELRSFTDVLAAALRARSAKATIPFDAAVSLDMDGEAPLVIVELSSNRLAATELLERALLEAVASITAPPQLGPLARAVVEVHRPDVPPVFRAQKPVRHVIERGDTLSEIALAHGLDLDELAKLNHLDVDRPIKAGAELKLSDKGPPLPKLYVVKPGDSLAKVAKHFGISEKSLLEVNRLETRRLSKGQKLVLPR